MVAFVLVRCTLNSMNIEVVGFVLDFAGKLLLSITVILVHRRMVREHRMDNKVIVEMRREQGLGILAIVLMLVGFFLELTAKF